MSNRLNWLDGKVDLITAEGSVSVPYGTLLPFKLLLPKQSFVTIGNTAWVVSSGVAGAYCLKCQRASFNARGTGEFAHAGRHFCPGELVRPFNDEMRYWQERHTDWRPHQVQYGLPREWTTSASGVTGT